ncbi:MAG TPA: pyrroloquinoline quinone-dependent dehydrogenase [Thermoanaerobaculia bacterium]|nr:pyrroloquinoline quinone-dependent dehydrogenase [Thermoanaerobaculia bacterium]
MTNAPRRTARSLGLWIPLALVVAIPAAAQRGVTDGQWPHYGGDLGATKYSTLDQIDADNVKELEVAWSWDSPDNALVGEDRRSMPGPFKSTPIFVDGVLYISTTLNQVAAIDAESGSQLWVFDTKVREGGRPLNLGFNHRGVGYWADGDDRRAFMPTNDAYLWALDARTGQPIPTFGEGGRVDLTQGLRREVQRRLYMVMSAPLVVGDRVIVGSSIFDGPTHKAMPPGDVRAFDPRTGKQVWTFHTIPQEGELGNDTWEDGSWKYTGNTNVWTLMSADPELGYVYLPVSTPTNDWYGGHRLCDNLFAESLVCLKAETGERVWHFQIVHHGLWDYDLPAAPTLVDITVGGRDIKAVAQITKQGFVFVFDRVTGEPVWPIEERPVPQSTVPGERSSPTQPFPTKPAPYEHQGVSLDNLIDFSPELRAEALKTLEKFDWGPLYTPPTLRGTVQVPGWGGGANWWGAAFDPDTGMYYIPSSTGPIVVGLVEPDAARSDFRYQRGGNMGVEGPQGLPLLKPPYGRITAIDLHSGEHAWMVPHGNGPRKKVIELGLPDPGPLGSWSATGPLLTKTLLFFGQGSRTSRLGATDDPPVVRAFDKATGAVIHQLEVALPPAGTPMTYLANGRQFVVVAAGGGPNAALIGLALPKARLATPSAGQ